jgi:hypothetical protein
MFCISLLFRLSGIGFVFLVAADLIVAEYIAFAVGAFAIHGLYQLYLGSI